MYCNRIIVVLCLAVALGAIVTLAVSEPPPVTPPVRPDPPTPPDPVGPQGGEPLGAGCIGGPGQEVMYNVTQAAFWELHPNRPWIRGNFSPTDAISPCNLGGYD